MIKIELENLLSKSIICNSCGERMLLVAAPELHVGDGLGWGSEYFWLCLNDDCPSFVNSWISIERNYGKTAGYRMMQLPNEENQSAFMILGRDAFTDRVVTEAGDDIDELKERMKGGL